MVRRKPKRDVALAIDTGGTKGRAAFVGMEEGIIAQMEFEIADYHSRDDLALKFISGFESMLKKTPTLYQRFAGVGHASAGVPDEKEMLFGIATNVPKNLLPLDMAPRISGYFGLDVMAVLKDVGAGALGEYMFGWRPEDVERLPAKFSTRPGAFRISPKQKIPERFGSVGYYTLSTGVNIGFFYNGEIFENLEIGHEFYTEKDLFGRKIQCNGSCNGRGHLEAVHSATGLGRMILNEYEHGSEIKKSILYEAIKAFDGELTEEQLVRRIPEMLYRAARKGDKLALKISDWHNEITCRILSQILGGRFQPQIIAFGGGLTKSMDYSIMPAFRKFADSVANGSDDYTAAQPVERLPVLAVCKEYGEKHPLLGAAAAVFRLYGGDV